jgi:anti-sigma factor RsiW
MTRIECHEVHDLLHALADGELSSIEQETVLAHLKGCPRCGDELDAIKALSARVRASAGHPLPAHLKERVAASIERQARLGRSGGRASVLRRLVSHSAAAAAGALLVIAAQWTTQRQDADLREIVSAHARSLQSERLVDVASADVHTVKPWFQGRVPFSPPVKDLVAKGYPLIGGRIDFISGRVVAVLAYERRKHRINVFIQPEDGAADRGSSTRARSGYNVLRWSDDGLVMVAISDLNAAELAAFAAEIRPRP